MIFKEINMTMTMRSMCKIVTTKIMSTKMAIKIKIMSIMSMIKTTTRLSKTTIGWSKRTIINRSKRTISPNKKTTRRSVLRVKVGGMMDIRNEIKNAVNVVNV